MLTINYLDKKGIPGHSQQIWPIIKVLPDVR